MPTTVAVGGVVLEHGLVLVENHCVKNRDFDVKKYQMTVKRA